MAIVVLVVVVALALVVAVLAVLVVAKVVAEDVKVHVEALVLVQRGNQWSLLSKHLNFGNPMWQKTLRLLSQRIAN